MAPGALGVLGVLLAQGQGLPGNRRHTVTPGCLAPSAGQGVDTDSPSRLWGPHPPGFPESPVARCPPGRQRPGSLVRESARASCRHLHAYDWGSVP